PARACAAAHARRDRADDAQDPASQAVQLAMTGRTAIRAVSAPRTAQLAGSHRKGIRPLGAIGTAARDTVVAGMVAEVLAMPGEKLEEATRRRLERRFGHDFADVRIHADARAASSAQALDAFAFTVGRHIVFDAGRYAPHTTAGRALLAHELAHVIQQ